jgi:hypothetical protein
VRGRVSRAEKQPRQTPRVFADPVHGPDAPVRRNEGESSRHACTSLGVHRSGVTHMRKINFFVFLAFALILGCAGGWIAARNTRGSAAVVEEASGSVPLGGGLSTLPLSF